MNLQRDSLAFFLDRVAALYPYGVPVSALATQSRREPIECVFVLVSQDSGLAEAHAELLDAVCTKGLKFDRKACDVTVVPAWPETSPRTSAPLTVVLGAQRAAGTLETTSEGKTLYSHPIGQIASEVALKREFWGHLQALLRG